MNGYNFTERVRRVLANGREESARLHHEYVGTEHMLLGLVREEQSVAVMVLRNLSIDLTVIRESIEGIVKRGRADLPAGTDLPYTARAKKVLELSMTEARELGHNYVGTEHLLLGLLREEKGIAAQALAQAGVTLDAVRTSVARHPMVLARAGTIAAPSPMAGEQGVTSGGLRAVRNQSGDFARQRAFVALWMTLGVVVLIESARPLLQAISGSETVSQLVVVLASVEILGAVLFLVPRTLKYGAWILLAVFAIAFVAHLAKGELAAPLLVYAAGTFLVLSQRTAR